MLLKVLGKTTRGQEGVSQSQPLPETISVSEALIVCIVSEVLI
jgi:hypothetical protein